MLGAQEATLRSLGAKGDGHTDDRAAIESAIRQAKGAILDGEGATYAVHGNIVIRTDVHLRNATFVQVMKPIDVSQYIPSAGGRGEMIVEPPEAFRWNVGSLPVLHANGLASYSEDTELSSDQSDAVLRTINLNTLEIVGENDKPVSVKLEAIVVRRGEHASLGDDNAAGIYLANASPITLSDIEVTGDGKGCGVSIRDCSDVKIERLNIHDMNWAPYIGDNVFEVASAKSIKEDFGWNNFPLYRFDRGLKKFVRARVREQIAGLYISATNNVQVLDSTIARLQTRIGDQMYPLQADGATLTGVSNVLIRNCQFSEVWEGIDLTGQLSENFVFEDCTASDTLTFGFKLAHPKRHGKLVNCTSYRAGNTAFVMESEVEDIEFVNCHARETGANGYWTKEGHERLATIKGFGMSTNPEQSTPARVSFVDCSAENIESPLVMDFGFFCEDGIDPATRSIVAISCTVKGERVKGIQGIVVE
ncbi:right-handed parallel beta-helix repeat-containing protein [Aeoliella sp. SH292]|uniref:right-handed parallel beta-helix repeat-containing protein n=1 Tax=Aeoliella sp. SH292 TaxID=3454464 RepID=UPI003F98DC41